MMTLGSPSPVLVVNNRPAPFHDPEHSVRGTSRSEVDRHARPESVGGGVQNVLTTRRAAPPAPRRHPAEEDGTVPDHTPDTSPDGAPDSAPAEAHTDPATGDSPAEPSPPPGSEPNAASSSAPSSAPGSAAGS